MEKTIKAVRISGDGDDALYNVVINGRTVMTGVSFQTFLGYLSNDHDDECEN
jgi:hypothetical protein